MTLGNSFSSFQTENRRLFVNYCQRMCWNGCCIEQDSLALWFITYRRLVSIYLNIIKFMTAIFSWPSAIPIYIQLCNV